MAKEKKKNSDRKKGKLESAMRDPFKALGNNTLVADVVAAALVATAAALKDSNKARRFASEAGDQLEKLSKEGSKRGGAMWQLALDIGRRALESVGSETPAKRATAKGPAKPRAPAKRKAPAKPKKAPTAPKAAAKAKPKRAAKKKA